jgi:hypothetical protein
MYFNYKHIFSCTFLLLLVSAIAYSGCSSMDRKNAGRIREDRIMKSNNYNGKIFVNTVPVKIMQNGSMSATMWRWISGKEERRPKQKPGPFKYNTDRLSSSDTSGLRVTWINHSTVLIKIDGKCFITDPV